MIGGRKNKIIARVHTKAGMAIKVWANDRTGIVIPSNWKQQAGFLAGEVLVTKRMANRRARRKAAIADYFKAKSNLTSSDKAILALSAVA